MNTSSIATSSVVRPAVVPSARKKLLGRGPSLSWGSAAVLISLVCSTAAFADRLTLDETRTQVALPLDTAPTIDGVIETDEWSRAGGAAGNFWQVIVDPNLEDGIRGGQIGDGSVNPPASSQDLSFVIYAGYDSTYLYVAVRVTDDVLQEDSAEAESENGSTWMDDSVEVFIDGDNSNFATRDTSGSNPEVVGTGGQFVITVNNARRDAEAGSPGYGESAPWYARTSRTDTGYDAEFRIALAQLGNPKPGDVIGFTVGVNDDDDGSGGERQVTWVGSPHTEATYGNLIIGARSYSAPKTTAAPTVDGKINAAEYATATEIQLNSFTAVFDIPSGDDNLEPTDLSYRAWVVHTADSVYVAVDVTDDQVTTDSAEAGSEDGSTWEDDSVEIFFDANSSKDLGRGAEPYEGQYVLTPNGAHRDNEANNPTFGSASDWYAVAATTPQGYAIEFQVKKSALLSPADGSSLGFQIAVNDDDGANRAAQMGWNGRAHSEFTYGTLKLAAGGATGSVKIDRAAIVGNDLVLTVATSNTAGTHAVQRASTLPASGWSDVSGVTFAAGAAGTVTATFPRPSGSPQFYRVVLR